MDARVAVGPGRAHTPAVTRWRLCIGTFRDRGGACLQTHIYCSLSLFSLFMLCLPPTYRRLPRRGRAQAAPAATQRRTKLSKQRLALKHLMALAPHGREAVALQGAGGHHARLARAEAVAFARGAAAREKAAAKARRGARRIEKKHKKAHKQAGQRMARHRRAGRV